MNEIKKLIILIVIILSTLRSNAQSLKLSDTVIVSKSKNELFSNALEWFANSFKSGKDVLQVSDKESGKIIGKGYFNTSPIQITIVVKDNKYRYEFNVNLHTIQDFVRNYYVDTTNIIIPSFSNLPPYKTFIEIEFNKMDSLTKKIYYEGPYGRVYTYSDNRPMVTGTSKKAFLQWIDNVNNYNIQKYISYISIKRYIKF